MKILIVSQYFWPENFKINDLCKGLIERGHEVTVYTGFPNYPEGTFFKGYSFFGPYEESWQGIRVIRSPLLPRGKNKGYRLALNYISFCIISSIMAPFLVRGKYDRIFIYQLSPVFAALPAVILKYIKKAPAIIWVTDLWPESLVATGVVKNKKLLLLVEKFVKFIYRNCDLIYITSKGFEDKIVALGVDKSKIKFWPQWAEVFFTSRTDKFSISDSRIPSGFIVMFAGNISDSQDFPTILDAAALLKNEPEIKFVILGDGHLREWAEKEVIRRELRNTVYFLGRKPIDEMPYYYSRADVMLVSLTDAELFSITIPSKIQTYLASGKPILASLNGEGSKIIQEWNAGLVCAASNPTALANRVLIFSKLSKPDLARMGENAFKCYQAEFEREKLLTVLETDFKSLV